MAVQMIIKNADFEKKIEGKKKRNADPSSVNTKAKKQNNLAYAFVAERKV